MSFFFQDHFVWALGVLGHVDGCWIPFLFKKSPSTCWSTQFHCQYEEYWFLSQTNCQSHCKRFQITLRHQIHDACIKHTQQKLHNRVLVWSSIITNHFFFPKLCANIWGIPNSTMNQIKRLRCTVGYSSIRSAITFG